MALDDDNNHMHKHRNCVNMVLYNFNAVNYTFCDMKCVNLLPVTVSLTATSLQLVNASIVAL